MIRRISMIKQGLKQLLIPGMLFEDMGITYLGPVDGHDVKQLSRVLNEAKRLDHAVLVHVLTKKGKGYAPAEKNPSAFHGVNPFDISTGKPKKAKTAPSYTDVFSKKLVELAGRDKRIVAITAAMPDGTGLTRFKNEFPDRFFDVGIAEQHAVTSAAGMAAAGMRPVVAVYSSFLQRGFDQILHDVCIQNLPVVFAVDRAGLVGSDGETHQGIFDLSYLTCIPNMAVLAPKNRWELEKELEFVFQYPGTDCHPLSARRRLPGTGRVSGSGGIPQGRTDFRRGGIALLAVGSMVSTAEHIRDKLKEEGYDLTLANGRFIKPIDVKLVDRLAATHDCIVTLEENVLQGGFGLQVTSYVHKHYPDVRVLNIALPDAYVEHGNVSLLREALGIDSDSIIRRMRKEGFLKE